MIGVLKIHIDKKSDIGGWECRGKPITIYKEDSSFTGTRKECAKFLQVAHQTISALVSGRYQTCKGWKLEGKAE